MSVTVNLTGPAPWGFRITGGRDFRKPIIVWLAGLCLWHCLPPRVVCFSAVIPGLDSELTMRRLEEDSEVYKMMQENREIRAAPRQSNTFRLLQVALETDGGGEQRLEGTGPVTSSVAGVQKLHTCEKCGTGITTQAVRIQESRYRHPSCYICADCGLNLKMRGHFWVGEELYCEKHARQRYQSPREGAIAATLLPPLW
uniref:PDZ and LIM domain 2 n=1 Tax=Chelonoidis abingdonii TaxID=106734 RepID=A0A8C0IYT9_CHEAB